jgi:hypothetical protein
VNDDDPIVRAISEWQRKYRIADDDPIIAVLELVRLQLQHASEHRADDDVAPPTFDDFRGTIELLDRRSKTFVQQGTDLVAELRRFALNLRRLNCVRVSTQLLLLVSGAIIGALIARFIW